MSREITTIETDKDWTKREIKNALEDMGTSVRSIAINAGLAGNTLYAVWRNPYPKAQSLIANALEIQPEEIWPSRYKQRKL